MIKNFLKIALRNMGRNKSFTAINIIGLSIGTTAAIVIFLIARFELNYDKAAIDGDRVYRIVNDMKFSGIEIHYVGAPTPMSQTIQSEVPGIESIIPVFQFEGDAMAKVSVDRYGEIEPLEIKKQDGIVFTNNEYFSMLPFHWKIGNAKAALDSPLNVVLTEKRATQYFPNITLEKILGRNIIYNDTITTTVSGIVKDFGENSSIQGKEFISFTSIKQSNLQKYFMLNDWFNSLRNSNLYLKLSKNNDVEAVEKRLNVFYQDKNKYAYQDAENFHYLKLQPLRDIHFNSLYASLNNRVANKNTIYGLIAIAIFLLILACINFINLTTANSITRAKEIGIRKTLGSNRKQLIFQFLGETFVLTFIACLIGCALTPLMIHLFADFIPVGVVFHPFAEPVILVFLLFLSILVSLFAGLYPAFVLSSKKVVSVLKNQMVLKSGELSHSWIRKSLTISQFVIAQFFLICTVIVSKQINYSLNTDMGFRKEAIINFKTPSRDTVANHLSVLINEVKSFPGVELVSKGDVPPAIEGGVFGTIKLSGADEEQRKTVQVRMGDTSYINLYKISLIAGRNIVESDTPKEILINESLRKSLGFNTPNEALGKLTDYNGKNLPIVGVINDFHESSFRAPVGPLIFINYGDAARTMHIQLSKQQIAGDWASTISKIGVTYHKVYPNQEFDYKFLDDAIANFYQTERRTSKLLTWATGLAILISSLGLIGLAIYIINSKTKEIGIRKVLGASIVNIIKLLSKDFIWLVLIAFIIAAPFAYWAMHDWLQSFVYRTALSWYIFIIIGSSMLLLTLSVLSFQIIKIAISNPVKSLRTE